VPFENCDNSCARRQQTHSAQEYPYFRGTADDRLLHCVIVSTDDEEIAGVAKALGAEVPFVRPRELSDDHIGTTEVVAHAIEFMSAGGGPKPSSVCCIYATAPFIRHADIKQGLGTLESGHWQYVFAATDFAASIFRAFRKDSSGGVEMFFPEYFPTRSQDLPNALHDAGQFYWGRPEAWLKRAKVFDALSTVVLLPRWRVHDIDTEDDWVRAELAWAVLQSGPALD
jgi:N-acylneuraminate cytidylyltransferase